MSHSDQAEARTSASAGRVLVGRTEYVIERPSGRKAATAFRLLKRVSGTVKNVTSALGEFEREYRQQHGIELDRVQARLRYPARPVLIPQQEGDGFDVLMDEATGQPVMRSQLDAMTDDDWTKAGDVLRLPANPTGPERAAIILDVAAEEAEAELYALLALFTFSNQEVAELRKRGGDELNEALRERGDELLDAGYLEELLELAVTIGETIDEQFRRKIAGDLGGRAGKALRLLGIDLERLRQENPEEAPQTAPQDAESTDSPTTDEPATTTSSSRPTSSSDSPTGSDGAPTPPSTPPMTSSSPSAPASTGSGT